MIKHLICTVGTSFFCSNLLVEAKKRSAGQPLEPQVLTMVQALEQKDWRALAKAMEEIKPTERVLGAEVNSIESLLNQEYLLPGAGLTFLHSATPEGRETAEVLRRYYKNRGFSPVFALEVEGLEDQNPKVFRSVGLRNLARLVCGKIQEYGPQSAGINATGGYKAQIAIAVLIGQAVGVPVYYMFERFGEIIAFPPMPVALDFEVWMRASGFLYDCDRAPLGADPRIGDYQEFWEERFESLVNRVEIEGQEYVELSPVGQIFHETFQQRFRSVQDEVLPVPALDKMEPRIEDSGHFRGHPEVLRFMTKVTAEAPFIKQCVSHHFNPDLPKKTCFFLSSRGIEGRYSDGSFSTEFRVETTAKTEGQKTAAVAWLNRWLVEEKVV